MQPPGDGDAYACGGATACAAPGDANPSCACPEPAAAPKTPAGPCAQPWERSGSPQPPRAASALDGGPSAAALQQCLSQEQAPWREAGLPDAAAALVEYAHRLDAHRKACEVRSRAELQTAGRVE
jgi:hypothetical protein